jgi:hypothetical protein
MVFRTPTFSGDSPAARFRKPVQRRLPLTTRGFGWDCQCFGMWAPTETRALELELRENRMGEQRPNGGFPL